MAHNPIAYDEHLTNAAASLREANKNRPNGGDEADVMRDLMHHFGPDLGLSNIFMFVIGESTGGGMVVGGRIPADDMAGALTDVIVEMVSDDKAVTLLMDALKRKVGE